MTNCHDCKTSTDDLKPPTLEELWDDWDDSLPFDLPPQKRRNPHSRSTDLSLKEITRRLEHHGLESWAWSPLELLASTHAQQNLKTTQALAYLEALPSPQLQAATQQAAEIDEHIPYLLASLRGDSLPQDFILPTNTGSDVNVWRRICEGHTLPSLGKYARALHGKIIALWHRFCVLATTWSFNPLEEDIGALCESLHNPNEVIRHQAARLLSAQAQRPYITYDAEEVTIELLVTLCDPKAPVRAAVAEALGSFGHPSAISALLIALRDPSEEVRRAASVALGMVGGD